MDTLVQSSLFVAVVSFALGVSTLTRNTRNKLFLAFAALCTVISLWALAFALEKIWGEGSGTFYRIHLFLNILLAPVSMAFIRVMIRIQDALSRRLLDLSIVIALCLTVALFFYMDSIPWVEYLICLFPTFIVLQIFELMWIDRRLRRGLRRLPKLPTVGFGRRNFIYIGALLALGMSQMDHFRFLGTGIPSLGNLILTGYLFFLSQAITQQRLLNFGALFSRMLVLLVFALTLTAVYLLLVAWVENSPGLFFLNSFIASFLLLMLLEPIRTLVGYFTNRLLTPKHRRLQQTLRELQLKISSILDPATLFQNVLLTTEQLLSPQWAAIFILRSDGTKFRRVRATGQEPRLQGNPLGPIASVGETAPVKEVLANNPIVSYSESLRKKGELAIVLDQVLENEIDRSASRLQREQLAGLIQGLKALGGNLLIPLHDGERMLGFVVVYVPAPPEPWGNNWGLLPVIFPYYQQAAQMMRSMEVYVRQREKERLATLGEMAAGLAHEIRNPLGAIKGAAQFLDPSTDRPESKFLRVIVEEVDRLNRVVTQFLAYSRPESVDFQQIDANLLTERTVDRFKPGIPPGIRLDFRQASEAARINASAEQIQQVLVNFMSNSVKALDKQGGGRLLVTVDIEGEGAQREVVLTVEDDGPGISKENLDKIFIPFFTTSPSGTGLGLPICQKIIEAHRGRIDVATEEGRFARFSVILPFYQEAQ